METILLLTAVLLGLLSVVLLGLLLRRGATPGEALAPRLEALERNLLQQFTGAATGSAALLERVKGELRQELADRLHNGLSAVREGVAEQLTLGRQAQDQQLGNTVRRLEEKFDALSERHARGQTDARSELTQSLTANTKSLEEKFVTLEKRTTESLEAIRGKVDERLGLIAQQVQAKLDENIKEGFSQFVKVQEHLKAAEEQLRNVGALGASINDLNSLLKLPHLRGKLGEQMLERILSDFLPAELFELQSGSDGLRADAVIRFPDRTLPIDSKFPREQVLPLFESGDPAQLAEARRQLERVIREQAQRISRYVKPEERTTDFALMFLPAETLWFEVIHNRELSEFLSRKKVLPVSPNTLQIVLHSIMQTYKWYKVARGFEQTAREIERARHSLTYFAERFEDLGRRLDQAQESYQTASGHLSRYQARIASLAGEAPAQLEFDVPERSPDQARS